MTIPRRTPVLTLVEPRLSVDSPYESTYSDPGIALLVKAIAVEVVSLLRAEPVRPAVYMVTPALLDVKQAAIYLGRTEQSVQHLIFQGELPVVRVGRRVHLDRRDLDKWIEKNKY